MLRRGWLQKDDPCCCLNRVPEDMWRAPRRATKHGLRVQEAQRNGNEKQISVGDLVGFVLHVHWLLRRPVVCGRRVSLMLLV